jgi:XTP/dITP diphosphohydrolase
MSSITPRLVIATRNQGKTSEIRTLLGNIPWKFISLDDFESVGTADELEDSYSGNATSKARYYARATGEWVLADDSGLEVAALAGAPGVKSARYGGPNASDEDRRMKLLREIASGGLQNRSARFVCAVAVAKPNEEIFELTYGVCEGSISEEPRGDSGFGYDPIFIPNGYDQTFGELSERVKNRISHRARAIMTMREFLLTAEV